MSPPMLALVTSPSSHRTISTTAIVYNIAITFQLTEVSIGWHVVVPGKGEPSGSLAVTGKIMVTLCMNGRRVSYGEVPNRPALYFVLF
jgi:hypothetical protein